MKVYKYHAYLKIETANALVVIRDDLVDRLGRNITSVRVIPDKYVGEHKNIRVGGCENIRVVTLKTKKNNS